MKTQALSLQSLKITRVGNRQPDPVPVELLAAAVLFVLSALMAF